MNLSNLLYLIILIIPNVNSFRLPTNIKPELYYLEIKTIFEPEFRFEGEVKIRIRCDNATSEIVLHARDLDIQKSKVVINRAPKGATIGIESHIFDIPNNFYIIKLERKLEQGVVYHLTIPFRAPLNTNMVGYYRSSYVDELGITKWLAVSKFEPLDARRAFPCFDEPAMKARFRVSLVRPNKFSSLSNMPLVFSESLIGGWTRDTFAETVPMSTYLVAFVVSEFTCHTSISKGRMFRVWARPSAIHQANYTLSIGHKLIDYYADFFGVDYAFPKMDFVAVPDFGSGAMENWGLCTYREVAMLHDDTQSSITDKEHVTRVVAHEIAHQWFGNLVTMQFWDDLWLNEGFATFAATLGVAHVQPEFNALEELTMRDLLGLINKDALQSSRAVSATIKQATDIPQMFDPITYMKGSLLLRMVYNFLGEQTFQRSVARYLRKYQFGNARQDDLWESCDEQVQIERAAGNVSLIDGTTSLKTIMHSWTLKLGYPIVKVSRKSSNSSIVVISQRRFLIDSSLPTNSSTWWIPLSYVTGGTSLQSQDTKPKVWLKEGTMELEIPESSWFLVNIGNYALCRVNYAESEWRSIFTALEDKNIREQIPAMSRAQLVTDVFDIARAGDVSYDVALESLNYMRYERHNVAWRATFTCLNFISRMTRRSQANQQVKRIVRNLLTPIYAELGKNPFQLQSSHFTINQVELLFPTGVSEVIVEQLPRIKFRKQLLKWSCSLEVPDCVQRASSLFKVWQQSLNPDAQNPVPVNFRDVVYCAGVRHGGEEAWKFTWQRYIHSNVGAEKENLLSALGCTNNTDILTRYLESTLVPNSGIRKQDVLDVFRSVAKGAGFYVAVNFLETRIKQLHELLQPKTSDLGKYFLTIADSMSSEQDLVRMRTFIQKNVELLGPAKRSVQQALETVHLNVQWTKTRLHQVIEWCETSSSKLS